MTGVAENAGLVKGGYKSKKSRRNSKGKKAKKSTRKVARKSKKVARKVAKKSRKSKRKLNSFMVAMLAAKKSNAKSFKYNNKTYVGKKHPHLGMIYKKK